MPRKVRILCEGISDKDSIKEILDKENLRISIVRFNSRSRLIKKVNNYIRSHNEVDAFIIVIDSHCTDPIETYNNAYNKIGLSDMENVKIHVIQHALESWFLAEGSAINRKYRQNFNFPLNPEAICKPDETLDGLLRRAGRLKYIKAVDAKAISKMLDTEDLKNKCENFKSFINLVIDAQSNNFK